MKNARTFGLACTYSGLEMSTCAHVVSNDARDSQSGLEIAAYPSAWCSGSASLFV